MCLSKGKLHFWKLAVGGFKMGMKVWKGIMYRVQMKEWTHCVLQFLILQRRVSAVMSRVWCHVPLISPLRRQRQMNLCEFKVTQVYIVNSRLVKRILWDPVLKQTSKQTNTLLEPLFSVFIPSSIEAIEDTKMTLEKLNSWITFCSFSEFAPLSFRPMSSQGYREMRGVRCLHWTVL